MLIGFIRRLLRGDRQFHQHADWQRAAGADWPERIMNWAATDRFIAKQGRSIGRLVVRGGGEQLVVYLKRHYRLPLWRGLLAALLPRGSWSPALEEYDNLEWARRQGLPVPRVAAAGQVLLPGGRLQSFLAVEELTGMLPLHEAVPLAARRLDPAQFDAWKRGLLAEMVRLCRVLHDRRWFHKDLYFCHFYIPEADTWRTPSRWRDRVFLIDLHRLQHHAWTWPWWRAKDLGQLLYSSDVEGVTPRDRLRFWRLYEQDGSRLLRWLVRLRARNNDARNRRKPQAPARPFEAA